MDGRFFKLENNEDSYKEQEILWKGAISGLPQETVLAPVMFSVYINDMTKGVESYMNIFADNAKILQKIQNEKDQDSL